jgi:hypothetical protein
VPEWANEPEAEGGAARALPGQLIFAAPAGSVMLSWTGVWHTRTPNCSDAPRRLFWQLYRRPDQPMWHRAEHLLSRRYLLAQRHTLLAAMATALVNTEGENEGGARAAQRRLRLLGMERDEATPWVGGWMEQKAASPLLPLPHWMRQLAHCVRLSRL